MSATRKEETGGRTMILMQAKPGSQRLIKRERPGDSRTLTSRQDSVSWKLTKKERTGGRQL